MLTIIKSFVPEALYALGALLIFLALFGKVRFAIAFIIFLAPLRNVVERLQQFPLGTQFMDLLILASLVGSFFSVSSEKSDQEKASSVSPILPISIFLILYTFVSLIRGGFYLGADSLFNIAESRVQDWKNFSLLPLVYFLVYHNIRDKKWAWRIFIITCVVMAIMAYYTAIQIRWFSSLESRAKINGTFQFLGPNEVAAFFNQYTMILAGVFLFLKKRWGKIGLLFLILANLYCMVFMYSRAAYIAVAVGFFFMFLNKGRWLLVPLLLVVIFWQVALPEKARERILSTQNEFGELENSAEMRVVVWQKAWDLFQGNPVVGVGFGVFRHLGFALGDTHNIYFKILVEQGILGMLFFALILLAFFREGWRLFQKGEDDLSRGLGLGLMACIVTLIVNNVFGDRWSYFELSAYLWAYAGLVSRLNRMKTMPEIPPQTSPVKSKLSGKKKGLRRQ